MTENKRIEDIILSIESRFDKIDRFMEENVSTNRDDKRFVSIEKYSYIYDGECYVPKFPLYWAVNCIPGTGPKDCSNCKCYGSWNGVFIGYCGNCAPIYEFKRGAGFINWGVENRFSIGDKVCMYSIVGGEENYEKEVDAEFLENCNYAADTYLYGYSSYEIGDNSIENSIDKIQHIFLYLKNTIPDYNIEDFWKELGLDNLIFKDIDIHLLDHLDEAEPDREPDREPEDYNSSDSNLINHNFNLHPYIIIQQAITIPLFNENTQKIEYNT